MLLDIGTEEIGHVEMISTMIARLPEGGPSETTEKAAANPALAAVLGGMNPQHAIVSGGGALPANSQGVPWNGGYIVASGNLLTDFRSNARAEGQGRLQTSRLFNMTDDPGVKDMLRFNLARDNWHQQQWLLGIEQLLADGLSDIIEDSNSTEEDKIQDHTYWQFDETTTAAEGRWASAAPCSTRRSRSSTRPPRSAATTLGCCPRRIRNCSPRMTAATARANPALGARPMPEAWPTWSTKSKALWNKHYVGGDGAGWRRPCRSHQRFSGTAHNGRWPFGGQGGEWWWSRRQE
jgi:Mn-containing catalase